MNAPIADLRVDYRAGELEVDDLAATWHEQLAAWLEAAREAGVPDPNAMVLGTVDDEYRVTTRTVLAKDIDARGVTFFTNYTSEKSHQLRQTRQASVTFPWYGMQRQATVIGAVELLGKEETAEYWRGRPRTSQLGAWASPQSATVRDREALEDLFTTVEARFADDEEIPPPPHWGGWRLLPTHVEFWQGRTSRLHDRLRFRFNPARGDWVVERLAP
ncbi:pyridoxamine 5'-phosphate oxidase [Actinomycetospora corticicola]|uniref:Pyridoxine/pyridoxamine 5'-phosphate oxidase n=1 Tax=Actinomycetospora corticicola TaxID=663602 RepID=A0A7Y9DXC4_9PSEU|nr:pyridoxamine 5'-phosphate oxidase [Actinomycetospora corticicola]